LAIDAATTKVKGTAINGLPPEIEIYLKVYKIVISKK
jgi:hypothetical protein